MNPFQEKFKMGAPKFGINTSLTFVSSTDSSRKDFVNSVKCKIIGGSWSHLGGCFSLFPQFLGKWWDFVIMLMYVEWWGHSEVVGTLKPYLL